MHKSSAFQSAAISKIRCNSTINICYATELCVRLNDDLIFIWGKKINYYELWPDVRTNGLQFNNRIKCCSCIHLFISHNIENLSPTFCTKKNEFCVTISEINNLKSGRTASVLRYRTIGNKRFVCLESAINMLPDYFVIRRRWGINMCCKSPVAQFFKKSIVCIDYVNCFLVATELSHLWTLHRPIFCEFFK